MIIFTDDWQIAFSKLDLCEARIVLPLIEARANEIEQDKLELEQEVSDLRAGANPSRESLIKAELLDAQIKRMEAKLVRERRTVEILMHKFGLDSEKNTY